MFTGYGDMKRREREPQQLVREGERKKKRGNVCCVWVDRRAMKRVKYTLS